MEKCAGCGKPIPGPTQGAVIGGEQITVRQLFCEECIDSDGPHIGAFDLVAEAVRRRTPKWQFEKVDM